MSGGDVARVGNMRIFEVAPPSGAPRRGGVIVIQEAFGVNDHIEDVARRFAAEGYHAVAPDLFHRSGGGTAPYDDFSKVLPLFAGLDDDGILADIDAAFEKLAEAGINAMQTGLVGFCFGGRVAFLAAARRQFGAAVGFYGGGIVSARFPQFPALVDEARQLHTPFLGLFGDLDESIPVDDVEVLREELKAAPVATEIVRYSEAGHGFHCDARAGHYHEKSAADAWQRTLNWFANYVS